MRYTVRPLIWLLLVWLKDAIVFQVRWYRFLARERRRERQRKRIRPA
jgi:hypothetical protein